MTVKTVGLDLAKDVFRVPGISATGRKIFNKKIKRAELLAFFETLPRCVVGMEACGSAHHSIPRPTDYLGSVKRF
jgi:transposase